MEVMLRTIIFIILDSMLTYTVYLAIQPFPMYCSVGMKPVVTINTIYNLS